MGRGGSASRSLIGEAAFTAVFQEHYTGCLRLARRLVRDEGLAQEVVQEVFLSWWRCAGGGYRADRGALGAWLSTLTHHKAVDAVRTSERHRRLLVAAGSALPHQLEPRLVDEVVWWELGKQSLVAALPTLTRAHREVLDLAYVHGMTQTQIAERLGIPLGTVKSRTHAGMLRLRAAVGRSWTPTGRVAPSAPVEAGGVRSPRSEGPSRPPAATTSSRLEASAVRAVSEVVTT